MEVFLFHSVLTWMLIGLAWTVQMVVYPQMKEVPEGSFPYFEKMHQKRISYLVVPLMGLELITAFYLLLFPVGPLWIWVILAGLLSLIWLSTFFVQVPLHIELLKKKEMYALKKLIQTHWIRTFLWTLRGIILFFLLKEMFCNS